MPSRERKSSNFSLLGRVEGALLFQPMFEYAANLEAGQSYVPAQGREFIESTLAQYVQ